MKKLLSGVLLLALSVTLLAGCGSSAQAPTSTPSETATKEVEEVKITNAKNVASNYDCIVVDGSPEGISAAISAARNGLKTLLICQDEALGGLYTLGELNFIDVPESRDGTVLVDGIFKEFSDAVGGSGFDVTVAKNTFYDMVKAENNLTLRVNSKFQEPVMDGKTITGVKVQEEDGEKTYSAPYVVDATPDGDVCAAAGVPYTYAGEDIGERDREMGVTLIFRLSGVDWEKVTEYVSTPQDGASSAEGGVNGNLAWGYSKKGFAYEPKDASMRLRGFNIARQENGDVLINSLIIFDVDALDAGSRAQGIERGQKELPSIVEYVRKNCVGFENAELVDTAEQLYVRETRHMDCEKMLTIDDVLENRSQDDAICVTNYPVDVQATKTQTYGTVVGFPDQYEIGYGSLVPKDVEGLLIVGRSAGYRSLAAGSARIVPTGMACGQAAGVAVKVATDAKETPRALAGDASAIKKMQSLLKEQGANLTHTQTEEAIMDHWAYPGLKVIRSMGFADGGYDNNYKLDDTVTGPRFANMTNTVVKKSGLALEPRIAVNEETNNSEMLLALAKKVAALDGSTAPSDFAAAVQFLQARDILDATLSQKFADADATADAGSCYMLAARLYEYLLTLPDATELIAVDRLQEN
ncbi:MAG: FAD-dependent oxidoreductase [Peptococcaceae bacterium]|nr:FAD-dependent oxidoreductase [Peptococcaceae bacterium]